MKKGKLVIGIIKCLHEYVKEVGVSQSKLSRNAYAISDDAILNATVRADISRTISQMLSEDLIKRTGKRRYKLTAKGVTLLIGKDTYIWRKTVSQESYIDS